MANIENLLKRRFLYTTETKWTSLSTTEQKQYDNSIVFIKSSKEGIGYAIYTQGHTFYTDDVTADNLLAKLKAGDNISLAKVTDEDGVEKVQITATDTTYTLTTTAITNGAKLTFTGSVNGEDGKPVSVNEFSIVGSGDTTVTNSGNTVTIDTVEYKGQNAIAISEKDADGDKTISLTINPNDKVLSQDATGLKTTLTLNYDSTSNKVQLLGNTVGDTNLISEFDASAFVKDAFLKSAELVNNDGKNDGKFLKLTFHTVDTDGDPATPTEEIVYVDVKDLFSEISGDATSFSVVEFEEGAYTVKNTLGTLTVAETGVITVTDGLATTTQVKTAVDGAIAALDADLDAVKADGADENEIAVVTGVTQVDGKITAVDSGLAATKTYVDNKVSGAEGELSLTNSANGYVFAAVEDKDGYVKASEVAAILNAAWAWGEI